MNGFGNIKERVKLREKFKEDTGANWENSQGEPDVDYVLWLESKLLDIWDIEALSEQLPKNSCTLNKNTCDKVLGCKHPHCNMPLVGNSLIELDGKTVPVTFHISKYKPKIDIDFSNDR